MKHLLLPSRFKTLPGAFLVFLPAWRPTAFGAFRVIIVGAVLYALGLMGMAHASTPLLFTLSTGVLIGMAQAGTTYAVIYGVIGRNVSANKRSWAMGVVAAAGSFGQFLMVPTEGFDQPLWLARGTGYSWAWRL